MASILGGGGGRGPGGREESSTSRGGCRGESRSSAVPLRIMNNSSVLLLQIITVSYYCRQAIINSLVHVSLHI